MSRKYNCIPFQVAAFSDANLKVPSGPDTLSVTPDIGVMAPGRKTTFRITSKSDRPAVHHLVVFHGSDLARRVYCKTRKQDESLLQHLMLGQQDFGLDDSWQLPPELSRVSFIGYHS